MDAKHTRSDSPCSRNVRDAHQLEGRGSRAGLARREFGVRFIARFHTKYQKSSGCWLWQAGKFSRGYGMVNLGRDARGAQHTSYAHRVAYVLAHGDIPAGAVVMHACDTPACVNPAHLSLGDQRQNLRDAVVRGRIRTGLKPGSVRWVREQRRTGAWPKRGPQRVA